MAGCERPDHHGNIELGHTEPAVETPEPAQEQSSESSPVEPSVAPAPSPIPHGDGPTPDPAPESEPVYHVDGDIVKPERISGGYLDVITLGNTLRVRGVTIFQAVITKEGRVRDLRFLKLGAPELAEPIRDAVKSWRFKPATLHGEPVAVYYNMTLHIRLQ